MAFDSVETWRLYRAEASVPLTTPRFDLDAARTYLSHLMSSRWWRWNIRDDAKISLDDVGNEIDGQVNSFSHPNDDPPTSWTISMHREQLDPYHLLHEVAHCIAPRWTYGGPTTGNTLPKHAELAFHGPEFATIRLVLTEQFAAPEEAGQLAAAYAHFGVVTLEWDDVLAALDASRAAEEDMAHVSDRHPGGMAAVQALRAGRRGRTPADLGWTLRLARRRARLDATGRRPTQRQIAQRLAPAIACTERDVSRVENLRQPPPDAKTYQVALAMAALFDIDPVQAQYQLGLDRDEWDLPLDALEAVNANWVRLVRELDDLVRQRPPRWYAPGR